MEVRLSALSVGQLYHPGRTTWPEAGEYNFRAGHHELRLFWCAPSESEVRAVREGPVELGLLVCPPAIWLLYRIVGACDWSDAPYTMHLVREEERLPPQPVGPETRALFTIVLVDAATGIVRALRIVSFSPPFTAGLHQAIDEQLRVPWDASAYDAALTEGYRRYPASSDMVSAAQITELAGAI